MEKLIIQTIFISKDNSTISGSLQTESLIESTVIGTASFSLTSSYSDYSLTSSYTTTSQTISSSYSINSISSSVAISTSVLQNIGVGINSTTGLINPNIYLGQYTAGANKTTGTGVLTGGALFSPIRIMKTCTCASMSVMFLGTVNSSSCFIGLYTNGTSSNLPEYRIMHGETSKSTSATVYNNYFMSQSTAVTLYKDQVYWVAMSLSGTVTTIPYSGGEGTLNYGFNSVLGSRFFSSLGLTISSFNGASFQIIRSGSTNLNTANYDLPLTCSQNLSQYNTGSVFSSVPVSVYNIQMPSLKIQY